MAQLNNSLLKKKSFKNKGCSFKTRLERLVFSIQEERDCWSEDLNYSVHFSDIFLTSNFFFLTTLVLLLDN